MNVDMAEPFGGYLLLGDLRDHLAQRVGVRRRLVRLQVGLRGVETVQPVVEDIGECQEFCVSGVRPGYVMAAFIP
jgi:hypothetical protein